MNKNIFLTGAAAAAFVAVSPAMATSPVAVCALADVSPKALACSGFFAGNLVGGSPASITAQKSGLAAIGFTWDGNLANIEKIATLNGSHTVDFTTLLKGISYVGFHFGGGTGSPGEATAFYKIDGGTGLDIITLAYSASSNAALYATNLAGGRVGVVPEPATWGMMVVGFGLIGVSRRRQATVVAA